MTDWEKTLEDYGLALETSQSCEPNMNIRRLNNGDIVSNKKFNEQVVDTVIKKLEESIEKIR